MVYAAKKAPYIRSPTAWFLWYQARLIGPKCSTPRAAPYVGEFSRFLVTPEKQVSYDGSVSVGGREGIKTCTIHAWQGWFWFLFLSDNTRMFAIREDDTCFSGLCGRVGVD